MAKLSGHHARALYGGYNLSTVSNAMELGLTTDAHDVAAMAENFHNFVPGQIIATVAHSGLFEQDSSHAALSTPGGTSVFTALIGQNTAPVLGDPAFVMNVLQGDYMVAASSAAAIPFTASLMANEDKAAGWGVALAPIETITTTADGASVDNGAASANGGIATLHIVTAPANDTYVVKVQHSTDDAAWVDLITFALDGSAIGGEFGSALGTVNQYIRYQATVTGAAAEDFSLAVSFARL